MAPGLDVPRPRSGGRAETVHLLVDSTGLKLCGAGEWLVEKHGTKTRRSWRKLHIGMDANTGDIVAAALTANDVDDASQVGPLLDQIEGPVASLTGDGAYDQESVYRAVLDRAPETTIIVPPRSTAVPSEAAETEPTQRDRHLERIAEKGRMGWQKASGYNKRSRVEAAIGRYKQVIGDGLPRARMGGGAPRSASPSTSWTRCWHWDARSPSASHEFRWGRGCCHPLIDPCNTPSGWRFNKTSS